MSVLKSEIVIELYKVVQNLGGQSDILSIIGSIGDTLDDDIVLSFLQTWNENNYNDSIEYLDNNNKTFEYLTGLDTENNS